MQCVVEEYNKSNVTSVGAPKAIEVEEFQWVNNGETGKTYTYRMSSMRFERNNTKAYHIKLVNDEGREVLVSTMSYYDFVDYAIGDCIGDYKIEDVAGKMRITPEEVWELLNGELVPLQDKIKQEFEQTEEFKTSQKNKQVIQNHEKNKKKFCLEFGVDGSKYDCCYNVFGELMDSDYLKRIYDQVAEREKFSEQSRKKHKQAWRNFTSSNDFFKGQANYNEEEKEMLSKFYKVLAKKFHPDANPGIDTSKEMQLLNEIKKEWGLSQKSL